MALFDWIRGRPTPRADVTWRVRVDGDLVEMESSRGEHFHASLKEARSVRVVPLSRGSHHAAATGWQVTLANEVGDILVGQPLPEWQMARELARQLCEATRLPMDALTEKLFSRVGKIEL